MSKDTKTIPLPISISSAKALLREAKTAAEQKDCKKAIKLLSDIIEVFENQEEWDAFMETSNELASNHIKLHNHSTALQIVEYAFKIHQEKCPHLEVWKYHLNARKSRVMAFQGKFKDALQYLYKAQKIIEKEGLSKLLLIENLIDQSDYTTLLRDYTKSEQLLTSAAKLLKENKTERLLMYFYGTKGNLDYYQSNFVLAKQSYEKCLQICLLNNFGNESFIYYRIGSIHQALGNRQEALEIYVKIIKGIEKKFGGVFNNKAKRELALTYNQMGGCLKYLGDFTQAIHYFEKAIHLYEQIGKGTDTFVNLCTISIAEIYRRQGNHTKQIEYSERALEMYENTKEVKHTYASTIYSTLANAYMDGNKMDKSLIYFEKALVINKQLLGENHNITCDNYCDLGVYWTKNKQYAKGLEYLHKALKGYKNRFGDTHGSIADAYAQIAFNLRQQGQLKMALQHYQLALIADVPNYQETDFYQLPKVEQCLFLSADYFLEILAKKATTLREYALTLEKNNFPKTLKALKVSLETCQLAVDYLQQLHKTLKAENSKLILGEVMPPIYQQAIKTSLLLNTYLDEPSFLEQTFDFHEFAKALLLRSSMKESEAKIKASIAPNLLQQEKNLRDQIEVYLQKIQTEQAKGTKKDENKLKEWKQKHFNELLKHQALIEQFEQDYPQYHQLKYNLQTVSIAALQKELDEDTVVVSYFIGSEEGYIFTVTNDEYEVTPFEIPSNFDQQIQEYLDSIQSQKIADFIAKSHALYFLLIEPISYLIFDPFAGNPKNIVIIPSAELNYLPFETLIREIPHTAQPAFHQLDYLLQHCQIQYHYSATLHHQSLQKNKQEATFLPPMEKPDSIDFLGFAPIYTSDKEATQEVLRGLAADYSRWATRSDALQDGTLAPLPFSEKEVQNIEELFTQKGLKGQSLLYDTATKEYFKTIASKAKYLHIAAHGLTNDEFPKLSGIVFHPDEENTEIHDSILSMSEMYQLQLQADLVVLSSCESGIGKLAKGEGMMAINRGFLYAGAKNVIYTLFKVLDKPSSELCEALFEEILEGKTYSEALRLAKLKLIQRENVDPKSWSGFVLLGA